MKMPRVLAVMGSQSQAIDELVGWQQEVVRSFCFGHPVCTKPLEFAVLCSRGPMQSSVLMAGLTGMAVDNTAFLFRTTLSFRFV